MQRTILCGGMAAAMLAGMGCSLQRPPQVVVAPSYSYLQDPLARRDLVQPATPSAQGTLASVGVIPPPPAELQ